MKSAGILKRAERQKFSVCFSLQDFFVFLSRISFTVAAIGFIVVCGCLHSPPAAGRLFLETIESLIKTTKKVVLIKFSMVSKNK